MIKLDSSCNILPWTVRTAIPDNDDHANFSLDNDGKFTISYTGKRIKQPLFNPSNHTYFNLSGDAERLIDHHVLKINADEYAALNKHGIPTGQLPWVTDTPFDFRDPVEVGPQVANIKGGLHHGFVLNDTPYPQVELLDRISGRKVTMRTNAPAVVVSSATNYRDDRYRLNGGKPMRSQLGLSLQAQKLPDAIHHKEFGSIIIEPNIPVTYHKRPIVFLIFTTSHHSRMIQIDLPECKLLGAFLTH